MPTDVDVRLIQNRYEITGEFLRCRFSTLFEAVDLVSRVPLKIRMLHDTLPTKDPKMRRDARTQILREGHALQKLQHRGLPKVLDIIEEGDRIYLLLDDFQGRTLEKFMEQTEGFFNERMLIRWLSQLVSVVEYLHSQDPPIIHRDLHPGNIIITPHGVLKIAEFGLARIVDPKEIGRTLFKALGKPQFADPEQLLQLPSNPGNDMYSLGAIMYFLAARTRPPKSLDRYYGNVELQSIRSLQPEISGNLEEVILKMMAPKGEDRYKDVYELMDDILKIMPTGFSTSVSLPGFYRPQKEKTEVKKEEISLGHLEFMDKTPHPEEIASPVVESAPVPVEKESEEEKKTLWNEFFNLQNWFGKDKQVKAAPTSTPGEDDLKKYPFIDLASLQLDRSIGKILPEGIAKSIQGVCIGKPSSREITVAVQDPTAVYVYDHINYATKGNFRPVLVRAEPVMISLAREYIYKGITTGSAKTWMEWLEQKKYEADKLDVKASTEELEIFRDEIKGPVIEAVDRIIKEAISIGASDVHLETYENEMFVRYRIDGVLHNMQTFSYKMSGAIVKRIKITAGMDIAQERITQGGRISVRVRDREFDLRVSVVPVPHGENVVMRLLNKGAFDFTLSDLGFGGEAEDKFRSLLDAPHGMILVSGPTGSGKSTTLYASLKEIARPDRKLLTVEDPIEYEMPGITQVQVNMAPKEVEKRVTFARALREFLRQDPDVILVGEIRDEETAAIAVQAALTGHLLLSTIHTNDAAGIITRLEDMGIEPYLIASTLLGGLAQRLARKICPHCKEPMEPTPELLELFKKEGITRYDVHHGKGCIQCRHTGTKGRLGLYEIMVVTPELRPMISARKDADEIAQKAQSHGMKTLYQDGLHKVAQGLIPMEEVFRVTMGGH